MRKMLDEMRLSNLGERRQVSMASAEKRVRADLQAQHPELEDAEIEARVRKIMERGRKPTQDEVLQPAPVTPQVFAERRARRKDAVKAGHYFTRGHEGSTSFWKTDDGLRSLAPLTNFLSRVLPATGFWSGNEIVATVMKGRLRAEFIHPMAAGLNKFRASTSCAIIFSAKATANDKSLMDVFGLTKRDIERAREVEAINPAHERACSNSRSTMAATWWDRRSATVGLSVPNDRQISVLPTIARKASGTRRR